MLTLMIITCVGITPLSEKEYETLIKIGHTMKINHPLAVFTSKVEKPITFPLNVKTQA